VLLKSTLHNVDNRKYICNLCQGKFDGRADKELLLSKVKRIEGCTDTRPIIYAFSDLSYSLCPGNFTSGSAVWILGLYREFQKGVLPFPGSLVDQPAKIMECFGIIDEYNGIKLEQERKKQEAKRGRNTGKNKRRY